MAARQCDEQASNSASSSGKWRYTVERRTPACSATALIEVRAGPSSSCSATALSVIRGASAPRARLAVSCGRGAFDQTYVSHEHLDTRVERPYSFARHYCSTKGLRHDDDEPGAKIVGPSDAEEGFLGSIGVRFMIDGADAEQRFSLVEHPMSPRALAAPLHRHTREDEYSYVLEGRMGALLGDEVVEAGPGDLVYKPRNQWHTFWNAGDEPCRILEIISPAGFEQFFAELYAIGGVVQADPDELVALNERYGLRDATGDGARAARALRAADRRAARGRLDAGALARRGTAAAVPPPYGSRSARRSRTESGRFSPSRFTAPRRPRTTRGRSPAWPRSPGCNRRRR